MKRAQFKLFTLCGLHLRSRQFTAATNTSNMRLFSLSSFVSGLLLGVGVSLSFSYKPVLHASWRDYSPFILSDVKKSSYNEKYSGSVSSVKESENSQAKENKGEDIESSGKAKQHVLGTGFIADAVEMVMDSVVNISVECGQFKI
ncbi:hypothetical protein HK096_003792 [Nowakowskiella sp. JEL0078]|nr:hypothetical protein HK096_003792 [Nowakowskiella sp. JEL0078]